MRRVGLRERVTDPKSQNEPHGEMKISESILPIAALRGLALCSVET